MIHVLLTSNGNSTGKANLEEMTSCSAQIEVTLSPSLSCVAVSLRHPALCRYCAFNNDEAEADVKPNDRYLMRYYIRNLFTPSFNQTLQGNVPQSPTAVTRWNTQDGVHARFERKNGTPVQRTCARIRLEKLTALTV